MRRRYICWLAGFFISVLFLVPKVTSVVGGFRQQEQVSHQGIVLADFEHGIPCSEQGDQAGFRQRDKARGVIISDGAGGSSKSALFRMGPGENDLFFQGDVRRKYLATKSERYTENGPNTLSFWIKVPHGSPLIAGKDKDNSINTVSGKPARQATFSVWTYHWQPGDMGVGGMDNKSLTTDSNMHGYSDFSFNEDAAGRWVKVVLSPSAFRISRNYYHFLSAAATTDDLGFFPSLRQLQFRVQGKLEHEEPLQLDEIWLTRQQPTAIFETGFYRADVSARYGDYSVPVVIKNPTERRRRYRVFISSFLGVERGVLNGIFAQTDSLYPMREAQQKTDADGGIGAADLVTEKGETVISARKEIVIPPGGEWRGKLVHRIKREMLGKSTLIAADGYEFEIRRNTLTTSVIVWDPSDPTIHEMSYVQPVMSNCDDGNHPAPAGFPEQKRPPAKWRSEDIPLNQVGGYFVSVLRLVE